MDRSAAPVPRGARRRLAPGVVAAIFVFALDQATKAAVRVCLPLHTPREIVPGFFYLRHELNDGAAWSILRGRRWFLVGVSVFAMWAILKCRRELVATGRTGAWAFSLLCGGIARNLLDRSATGKLVDFLDFVFGTYHYPTFNVADSAICIGMALWVLGALRAVRR